MQVSKPQVGKKFFAAAEQMDGVEEVGWKEVNKRRWLEGYDRLC